ncbi:MAG: glycoside hydrolase family 2 [Planctomycetes bacterium]|nr:glycoside hydrolase family 2 [Planctomycetota bacterium]
MKKRRFRGLIPFALATAVACAADGPISTVVVPLDGEWSLATDPKDEGRAQKWFEGGSREGAKPAHVPWIIQDPFPGYHGLAWYWRTFEAPPNPHPGGRYLLRFWAVDYKADVWVNGSPAGGHEGGETPFVLDVTDAIEPGATNLVAVRVLNPTHTPIDGIVLNETPHRNKALPYTSGSAWDQGGIVDSVELLATPAVRIDDLFVRADPKTGIIRAEIAVRNAGPDAAGEIEVAVAPAASGETIGAARIPCRFAGGDTRTEARIRVASPRLWDLDDPFLYRVTARVRIDGSSSFDERSTRCGFREFRFDDGWFRLNGRRIYLRSSHTGNCCPIGLELPHDPDFLRRDLLNVKAMRFNMIRFISGIPKRDQLDSCDEIGLLVYEESYAGWCLADSPKMAERFDRSTREMILRDRNHPSLVIWGLLNETPDGPVLRHAVATLALVRSLDDSRVVLLNSGNWHDHGENALVGLEAWRPADRTDPCATHNGTTHPLTGLGITWQPGQFALHPGVNGEACVARWTAPAAADVQIAATFSSIAERATTDVHVLHNGESLHDGAINVGGAGASSSFSRRVTVRAGDTVDFAVGFGNGNYGADTTALAATIAAAGGGRWDVAKDFTVERNPSGAWSYGMLAPAAAPDAKTFAPFASGETLRAGGIGSISNPGSTEWEDILSDKHPYQRVPHTVPIIHTLRTISGGRNPLFLSEYGVGSAIDLLRVVRSYEQAGKPEVEDAQFYRAQRDRFLADWERWKLSEAFARPEDFLAQCVAKMAGQRLLGINAIRSNPNTVGYSLTGTVDQGMTGEGLTTTFRELKPGTVDALFDALAPLRFCLFAEPIHIYRGGRVRLEAVLANEDVLAPGRYPVRIQVVGPGVTRILERRVEIDIPDPKARPEPPMVFPVFAEDAEIDGPAGEYRLLATLERGAAAAGESVTFFVGDPAAMPPVEDEIVLWGEDPPLAAWLAAHGIRARSHDPASPAARRVFLAGAAPPTDAGAAFEDLGRRIRAGSTAIFLAPEIFRKGDDPVGWLPLERKGAIATMASWVYLKDEWAKQHPIFDGLPAGGILDLAYYRELIPDHVWVGQDLPAEAVAGAINTSQAYSSGLLIAVHALGEGRLILNTMRIRENLGSHPAAERLLRNLLRYAGK